jgi:type IV pilus assembly protein PilA
MKLDKKMQGFSLIELLVVVAIIGILAAVGTVGYSNYMNSTKARVTVANAESVQSGLKTLAAAANTGAGCSNWTDCYAQVTKDIKKNPYDSADTAPIVTLSATTLTAAAATATGALTVVAPSTVANTCAATTPALKLGQVGVLRNGTSFDVTVIYCSQNQTTTGNYDVIGLPTFNFGQ